MFQMRHALVEAVLEVADETDPAGHLEDLRELLDHGLEQRCRVRHPVRLDVAVGELPARGGQLRISGRHRSLVLAKRVVEA